MKKQNLMGAVFAMFGMSMMNHSNQQSGSFSNGSPATQKNKPPRRSRTRHSEPSPYFGQRSKIVVAETKNKGVKFMKLKTALKYGLEFKLANI